MSTSLYRKYRPSKFSELIGQDHVSLALQNSISEARLSHAYLFSGTRGTGKTSTARILGTVLNCETFKDGFPKDAKKIEPCGICESCLSARKGASFDVIELDAASNNGVEDMRDLIEKVSYTSAGGGQKIYIIDEVHELTGRAANTLLKTLEEPPEHVVFILATTNPEKVLPTIRSRTQHFEFKTVADKVLFEHVKEILKKESKTLDEDAIDYVVRKGAGSVRDTLSFLDQILAQDVSTLEDLSEINGAQNDGTISDLILASTTKDIAGIFDSLSELVSSGKEPRAIVESIISYARDCLVLSLNPDTKILLSGSVAKDELKNLGEKCGTEFLTRFIVRMGKAIADMRGNASVNPLLTLEIALLDSINVSGNSSADTLPALRDRSRASQMNPQLKTQSSIPQSQKGASLERDASATQSLKADKKEEVVKEKPATLGALKKASPETKAVKKIALNDITASWSKVIMLLSPASQTSIRKTEPIKLENDILTFGVDPENIEEVKMRFKKDASIIRGFLESLHEQTFRFQIVPTAPRQEIPSTRLSQLEEKEIEGSIEYDPVDHILNKFGGEIVPE
jgi:DNA polymerase-3 subunit gamma/tau